MPYNILLVEDSIADRELFDEFILKESSDYECTIAASYREAERVIAKSKEFDVAVLDYSLGDGYGLDLIPVLGDTPAIITTAAGDENIAVKAMKLGARDYFVKDLKSDYLNLLKECIRKTIAIRALNKKTRILSNALRSISDAVYVSDTNHEIIMVNQAFLDTYGYGEAEVVGKQPSALLNPVRNEEQGTDPDGWTILHHKKDGKTFPVLHSESHVEDSNGDVLGIVGVSRDISTHLLLGKKFATTVDAAPNGIIIVNEKGIITLVNEQTIKYFGYTRNELLGQPVEFLIPAKLNQKHIEHRRDFLCNPKSRPMGSGYELYGVRKNGSEFPVEIGLTPVERENGIDIMAVVIDITLRKQMEEEHKALEAKLRHTQKLESLGVLAGGIAHDFNNILTGILGYLDLALPEIPRHLTAYDLLNKMHLSALRAADLCRQMLAYSGKGKFVISNLNLNSTISEISHLLQMSVSKTAAMEFHLDPKLPEVDGDAAQIHQVLMNLIINASEALEGKTGTITVSTGTRKCQREDLDDFNVADELPEGTYVFVEVSDTGCGMDPETLKRVFDPFFTTKFTGRGLGMAAVLGIVRSHRGVIKVNSRKNVGTTFTMLLPSSQDKKHSRKAESTAVQLIASSGKILVIDDEEVVLDIVKTTLEQAGFVVLTSRNGREGLEKFQKNKDEISLIVLDLTMPHMDGEEVLQRVKSQRKDIPVLMMSGYNQQSIINQFVDEDLAGFLQKPLRPTILLNAVNKILTDSRL